MSINYGCEFCELHYSYSGKYCGQFHNNIFPLKKSTLQIGKLTLEVLLACCMHYNLKVPLQDCPKKTAIHSSMPKMVCQRKYLEALNLRIPFILI